MIILLIVYAVSTATQLSIGLDAAMDIWHGESAALLRNATCAKFDIHAPLECCMQAGIHSTLYKLPSNIVEADVQTIVEQLSNDTNVDGILVQLPLPAGLKEEIILQDISPVKDVDGECSAELLMPGLMACVTLLCCCNKEPCGNI